MKKSYTLLISIVLITIFSYLAISILVTNTLRTTKLSNQYLNVFDLLYHDKVLVSREAIARIEEVLA